MMVVLAVNNEKLTLNRVKQMILDSLSTLYVGSDFSVRSVGFGPYVKLESYNEIMKFVVFYLNTDLNKGSILKEKDFQYKDEI